MHARLAGLLFVQGDQETAPVEDDRKSLTGDVLMIDFLGRVDGIEFAGGSAEAASMLAFLAKEFPKDAERIRFGTETRNRQWQDRLESVGAPKRDQRETRPAWVAPRSIG